MNLFNLGGWFTNLWMDLWISLNSVVYQLIEWLYEIFEAIANVNLFSKDAFNDITSRLYVVIGIAMLFIFAYNIILMIINPDDKKSIGNTSKIVKETVIAFVLIILLPTIFNYMAIFQKNVLDSHILEQIILGDTAGTTVDCDFSELELINSYVNVKNGSATQDMQNHCNNYKNLTASQRGAYLVAPTMFTAFFHPTNYGYDECVNYLTECKGQGTSCNSSDGLIATDDDKELCAYYVYDSNIAQFKGGIANFVTDDGVYSSAWSDKGIFDFNYLIAFAAGILGVWMFICYAMAIGVRVAKLGFFQIISPIPVMLRIIPKQKEAFYDKWFKHLVDAYLDVFIRLAIIYFCLFAISLVPDVMDSLFASLTGNIFTKALATVIVILGILKFAQECPDLMKEFFGSSGKFALKSPKQQLSENKVLQGGISRMKGFAGGATALATTKANQIKNFGKNWNRDDANFSSRARQIRDLASNKAYKKGYESTKDAKTIDDWGYNVKKSAVDTLKDRGYVYRAKQSLDNIKENLGNVIDKNYFSQDTKALQSRADALELIAKEAKLIIGKLEDDPKFKGIISQFDSAIDNANKMNRPDLVSKITKEKVDALNAMRNALLIEKLQGREAMVRYELDSEGVTKGIVDNLDKVTKGISREVKTAVENLNSAIGDNFDKFQDAFKQSNTDLGVKLGDDLKSNIDTLQSKMEAGDAKLIKNIKTVTDDAANSAKAEIINMEKKDKK